MTVISWGMRIQPAAKRGRVSSVVMGSTVAFVGLAILFFWLYFINKESVYDSRLHEGRTALYAVFYLALAVHLFTSIVVAVGLMLWMKAPVYRTLVAVAATFAVLMLPLLYIETSLNVLGTGESFPIPGIQADD